MTSHSAAPSSGGSSQARVPQWLSTSRQVIRPSPVGHTVGRVRNGRGAETARHDTGPGKDGDGVHNSFSSCRPVDSGRLVGREVTTPGSSSECADRYSGDRDGREASLTSRLRSSPWTSPASPDTLGLESQAIEYESVVVVVVVGNSKSFQQPAVSFSRARVRGRSACWASNATGLSIPSVECRRRGL